MVEVQAFFSHVIHHPHVYGGYGHQDSATIFSPHFRQNICDSLRGELIEKNDVSSSHEGRMECKTEPMDVKKGKGMAQDI